MVANKQQIKDELYRAIIGQRGQFVEQALIVIADAIVDASLKSRHIGRHTLRHGGYQK